MRTTTALVIAIAGFGWLSCVSPTDPFDQAEKLHQAQKGYVQAIRWGNLEKAAHYVDPELREEFLKLVEPFENVRITDIEVGELDLDDGDFLHAEVDVTYRGYALTQYVERKVNEQQVWVRDEGLGNKWHVRPQLASILDGIGARP